MEDRRIIDEKIYLPIKQASIYRSSDPCCTWAELLLTPGILVTDKILQIGWREQTHQLGGGIGGLSMSEWEVAPEEETDYTPTIIVIRKRPETDGEFYKRMKQKSDFDERNLEREKLEYLRLKAKFEMHNEVAKEKRKENPI